MFQTFTQRLSIAFFKILIYRHATMKTYALIFFVFQKILGDAIFDCTFKRPSQLLKKSQKRSVSFSVKVTFKSPISSVANAEQHVLFYANI